MRSVLVFLVWLILPSHLVSAQAWREAVLVKTNGDTLKGEIDFVDPDRSVSEIHFRASQDRAGNTLTTSDIKSFKMARPEQYFEVLEATINYYSRGVVKWGDNPIIDRKPLKVFAEVIRQSTHISLYSVHDDDAEERFFVRKGAELVELVNTSYQVFRDANTYTVHEPRYEGQLRALLSDCKTSKTRSVSYDGRSMGRAIDDYLACKGEPVTTERRQPYELISVGVFATVGIGIVDGEGIGGVARAPLAAQLLSRKNRNNQFLWLELGLGSAEELLVPVYFGAFAGTYIGYAQVQPLVNVGVTTSSGTFTGGLGVAYRKSIILSGNISTGFIGERTVLYTVRLAWFPRLRRS